MTQSNHFGAIQSLVFVWRLFTSTFFWLSQFTMNNFVQQGVCLKFYVENMICCAESLKISKKTFGGSGLSKTAVHVWYKEYKIGRTVAEDLLRSGCPSPKILKKTSRKWKNICLKIIILSLSEGVWTLPCIWNGLAYFTIFWARDKSQVGSFQKIWLLFKDTIQKR